VKRQVTGGFGWGFGSGAGLRGVLRFIVSSCSGGRDRQPLYLFVDLRLKKVQSSGAAL
jgi:hypothetical protein